MVRPLGSFAEGCIAIERTTGGQTFVAPPMVPIERRKSCNGGSDDAAGLQFQPALLSRPCANADPHCTRSQRSAAWQPFTSAAFGVPP
jgi:hypothetical protein